MKLSKSKLARARIKAGLENTIEAAKALGVSRIHLLSVERGGDGSIELLQRMADLYKLDLQEVKAMHHHMRLDQAARRLEALRDV